MRLSTVAIAAVCATLATLVVTAPAQAIGNNRAVERSCGKNYVSSGIRSTDRSWAMPQKQSGTCAGRLSAALELPNGYRTPRKFGTNLEAYTTVSARAAYGLHWGCDACELTKS